jgi:hypothetical protein
LSGLAHEGFEPAEATWRGISVRPVQGPAASPITPRQAANAA